MLRVIVLLGFACGAAQRPPARTAASESFTVGNGVVVSGSTVYVMSPEGLVAVELATGTQRWSRPELAKPLVVRGDALVAADQKGDLRIVDARTGKPRRSCATIAGVRVGITDTIGYTHASRGWLDAGRAYVYWLHRTIPARGDLAGTSTHDEGVTEIDVDACTHRRVEATEPMTTPTGTKFFLDAPKLYREHEKQRLTTIDLPANATITPSADRRHVIVGTSKKIELYDIDSGVVTETLAVVEYPSGGLLRGRLLVFCDVAVHVFHVDKKREVWSRPIRSTDYRGPPITP